MKFAKIIFLLLWSFYSLGQDCNPGPSAPTFTIARPNCLSDEALVTITTPASQYSFSNGISWIDTSSQSLEPGTYFIKIKDEAGCISPSTEVTVTRSLTTQVLDADILHEDCNTAMGKITINTIADLYSFDGGATWSTNNVSSLLPEGYYTIKAKDSYGCTNVANVMIAPLIIASPSVEQTHVYYCQGAPLQPLTAEGSNLLWYDSAEDQTGSSVAPLPPTDAIGTYIYYVTQTVAGCEGQRAMITVHVSTAPPAPEGYILSYCQYATTPPLTATGENVLWYTTPTEGTGTANAPVPDSSIPGITNYYVTQTVNGCESNRAEITVEIQAAPAPPSSQNPIVYVHNDQTATLTAQGNNLTWYNDSGELLSSAPTPSSTSIAITKYYVRQMVDGCVSLPAEIIIEVVPDLVKIDFPRFFTPNGDGINEYWNIYNPENKIKGQIHIFDRYGKILYTINTQNMGWDGTFKGKVMPATDYWFMFKYIEYGAEKQYISHFSLVR